MNSPSARTCIIECGRDRLVGITHEPAVSRGPLGVVVIVGGPQYRAGSHRQFTLMARLLAAEGIPVLRFDLRGMGDSSGRPAGFEAAESDVRSGIDAFFRIFPNLSGVVLWGLCDGASAILLHGCEDPRVRGIVLVNPWVETEARQADAYIRHYYWRRLLQPAFWTRLFSLQVAVAASVKDWIRKFILARSANADPPFVSRMLAGMEQFGRPVLILLSEQDLVARQFAQLCRRHPAWQRVVEGGNVTVRDVAGADHTFSARKTLESVSRSCASWIAALAAPACR